jgi:digeranylgeranylglycerophospholipid reductase
MAQYQTIVVGAGPAGALTARYAAVGARVLLLDRRAEIGVPARCGGLIRTASLARFALERGPWILTQFDRYCLISPGGNSVCFKQPDVGTLLDRRIFDAELVRSAMAAGAKLITHANVENVIHNGDRVTGVEVMIADKRRRILCDLVVAADGVASRIARLAGIGTQLTSATVGASVSGCVDIADSIIDGCELHFGREIAPGGYAWVFPLPSGKASVGVGIIPRQARDRTAMDFFKTFISKRFPRGRLISFFAGGIPLALPIKRFWKPGLVVVGDAARHVNPLTGAGIYTAMCAGKWAGKAITSIYLDGVPEMHAFADYETCWRKNFESFAVQSMYTRKQLDTLSDSNINWAVSSLGPNPVHHSVAHSLMALTKAATLHNSSPEKDSGTLSAG